MAEGKQSEFPIIDVHIFLARSARIDYFYRSRI